ncbi:MAG: DUF4249 family protein [Bacteroidetes bacterium]|nr:DUF4249 family protein [Bacteroidota bacterium]
MISACVREVPFTPKTKMNPVPVFHMYINPDSPSRATFWRSSQILENPVFISDAQIELMKNGISAATMNHIVSGNYAAAKIFKPGDSFSVNVQHTLGSFTVNGQIPSRVVIPALDTATGLVAGVGRSFIMRVTIADSARYENQYRLYVTKTYYQYIYDFMGVLADSMIQESIVSIGGRELPFLQNNFNNYTSRELLFTDATFNGVNQKLEFYTTDKLVKTNYQRPLKLTVHLENTDPFLYNYYNTRNAHLWQQQSITQIPGALQGNIPGGYGVTGAFTEAVWQVILP